MCGNSTLPKSQRLPKDASDGQIPKWDALRRLWVAANESGADPLLLSQIEALIDQKISDSIIDNLTSELSIKSLSAYQGNLLSQSISQLENSKQDKLNYTAENLINKNAINGYLGLDANARASGDALINLINDGLTTAGSRTWSIDQIKGYVASLVDTTVKVAQAYTPNGNYPTTYNSNPIQSGDSFRCASGQMGGTLVDAEDLLIARVDNPGQDDSNWMVIEGNRTQSTETKLGLLKLVRQTDVESAELTDNLRSLTVLRLAQWWSWIKANSIQTWTQIITFSAAPVFSSTTANQYLKVGASKALESVGSIPVGDISGAESSANKATNLSTPDDNTYPTTLAVDKALKVLPTQRKEADYTLVLADAGSCIEMNVGISNNCSVPEDATVNFPTDTQIVIAQYGLGQTTIHAEGSVTLRAPNGAKISKRYASATIKKIAANEWYVWGDLSA